MTASHTPIDHLPSNAGIQVGPISKADLVQVVGVLSRGMRDNPLHIAAFGDEPTERERRLRQMFSLTSKRPGYLGTVSVARQADGTIVGVCGAMPPGKCLPNPVERVLMLPLMLPLGVGNARRVVRWMGTWADHDPDTRHWHVGPLAVDAHLQGQGIGSMLMQDFCRRMDAAGEQAYLETDKEANIRFYQKFGFEVIQKGPVLGVPHWYMLRKPDPAAM
ncbi:MAG TPA: GNAT family N-acetyltransferase [Thermomicrobiales bacterium]|nr:GNAT family N-acetyltransferase [Thermomicrobiales bacterium]